MLLKVFAFFHELSCAFYFKEENTLQSLFSPFFNIVYLTWFNVVLECIAVI